MIAITTSSSISVNPRNRPLERTGLDTNKFRLRHHNLLVAERVLRHAPMRRAGEKSDRNRRFAQKIQGKHVKRSTFRRNRSAQATLRSTFTEQTLHNTDSGQVFWLPDRSTDDAFPQKICSGVCRVRPRLQRRDRNGIAPYSLFFEGDHISPPTPRSTVTIASGSARVNHPPV